MMKKVVVLGAGGFIGWHLVTRLVQDGYHVRGVDVKYPEFKETTAHEFIIADLRDAKACDIVIDEEVDEVYQLAADMGGASYIFTGDHDADLMYNSALINLNVCHTCVKKKVKKIFYSSSACIYPSYNQTDPPIPNVPKIQHTPHPPTQNMDGKNYYQRTSISIIPQKSPIKRTHSPFPQYFWSIWNMDRRQRKSPSSPMPKDCISTQRRCHRNFRRRTTNKIIPIYRRMYRRYSPSNEFKLYPTHQYWIRRNGNNRSTSIKYHDNLQKRSPNQTYPRTTRRSWQKFRQYPNPKSTKLETISTPITRTCNNIRLDLHTSHIIPIHLNIYSPIHLFTHSLIHLFTQFVIYLLFT